MADRPDHPIIPRVPRSRLVVPPDVPDVPMPAEVPPPNAPIEVPPPPGTPHLYVVDEEALAVFRGGQSRFIGACFERCAREMMGYVDSGPVRNAVLVLLKEAMDEAQRAAL